MVARMAIYLLIVKLVALLSEQKVILVGLLD